VLVISIAVDFDPTPAGPTGWPLWLVTATGPVPIDKNLGDGLVFRAANSRTTATGCRSTSILLHYVNRLPRTQSVHEEGEQALGLG
jgi:hypothetical protein